MPESTNSPRPEVDPLRTLLGLMALAAAALAAVQAFKALGSLLDKIRLIP